MNANQIAELARAALGDGPPVKKLSRAEVVALWKAGRHDLIFAADQAGAIDTSTKTATRYGPARLGILPVDENALGGGTTYGGDAA